MCITQVPSGRNSLCGSIMTSIGGYKCCSLVIRVLQAYLMQVVVLLSHYEEKDE